jgi:hypothetical protein
MVVIHTGDRSIGTYGINKNYKSWDLSPIQVTCHPYRHKSVTSNCKIEENLSPIQAPTKESKYTKERKKTYSRFLSSTEVTDDAAIQSDNGNEPCLISRRKRKLSGKRLETFLRFWDAFGYKQGRAEAIDAWIDIPKLTMSMVETIVERAKQEAERRPELIKQGRTPKMAQGWLSGRRWEDEVRTCDDPDAWMKEPVNPDPWGFGASE